MVAAIAAVVIIMLILVVAIPWLMSGFFSGERAIEEHLRDAGTPTVTWEVPDGVDAAVVSAALTKAGFPNVADASRGHERLLVECAEGDRARMDGVIAHLHLA